MPENGPLNPNMEEGIFNPHPVGFPLITQKQ